MWAKLKKLILALSGSVLIHLVLLLAIGVLLALQPSAPSAQPTPPPIRLQIVPEKPTPPPAPAAQATPRPPRRMIDVEDMVESSPPPAETLAQGAKNTADRSELPPTGTEAAPSQNGKVRPRFVFDTHKFVDAGATPPPPMEQAAAPAPETGPPLPQPNPQARQAQAASPPPVSTPPPPAETPPPPAATAAPDEFAMLEPAPTPKPPDFDPFTREPQTEPAKPTPRPPASSLSEEEKTQIRGNLINGGPSSIAAVATPQGRYSKAVSDAIRARWYARVISNVDVASYGTVKIHFSVDRRGKVVAPHVISNSGNEALAAISLQAIMEARIPPVPAEVTAAVNNTDVPLDFDFSLY